MAQIISDIPLRDLGVDSPFSMKDGVIFNKREQFALFALITFTTQWHYNYKIQPRKYKVHRSLHPFALFGLSLYLPYRYSETINTVLFQLSRSSNPYVNMLVRGAGKVIVYGASVMIGQIVARWYWVYKRAFNATKQATFNTYYYNRVYSNDGPFTEAPVFDEVRPKLVN
ncbi:hypothetical protein FGO68_gene3567 [Halteria grandinella]|uniref:Uncharacterized protein n=1 Tax=Halteria grandinella TaxID=5974 RepID=A0A8J8NBW7_HALGN|nr:hypothetical protein FGO68_gene3567 [Halteria grandinella]